VLSLQAVVWKNKKAETRALDCLRQALVLAEPEGYVRVFLNRGRPMQELLQHARRQGLSPDFVTRILTAFAAPPSGKPAAPLPARPAILSKREVELLGLIAAGCSNKEIANQLVISLGTVKRHTVNIFNKLDVKNRTEAVARARELELF
jgi:LuxR family maltose regulon positive regulatory protein